MIANSKLVLPRRRAGVFDDLQGSGSNAASKKQLVGS